MPKLSNIVTYGIVRNWPEELALLRSLRMFQESGKMRMF